MSRTENPMLDEFSIWLQSNQVEDHGAFCKAIILFLDQKIGDYLSLVLQQQEHIHYSYNFYDNEMAKITLELQKGLTNLLKLLHEIESTIR